MSHLYKRGNIWHCEYSVLGVRHRKSTGTRNKQDAQRIVDKWIADAQLTGRGVSRETNAPLSELIAEFDQWLAKTTPAHRKKSIASITKTAAAAGWKRPRDITHLSCETAIRSIIIPRTGKPLGNQSIAHWMTAMKGFTKWLVKLRHALPSDPLELMRRPPAKTDRKFVRRFLLPEEWKWLKETPNAVLYQTAIETGFRSAELQAIQPHHVKADHILLPPNLTKNGKQAKQWISKELHRKLIGAIPFEPGFWVARTLRDDLALARKAYEAKGGSDPYFLMPVNEEGKVLDFHSLRHSCGAWLTIAGVSPKIVQEVMRHANINITFTTYGHLMPDDTRLANKHIAKMLEG